MVTSFSFEALFSLNKFCLSKMMKAILISNQHIGEKISGFVILNDTKLLQKWVQLENASIVVCPEIYP